MLITAALITVVLPVFVASPAHSDVHRVVAPTQSSGPVERTWQRGPLEVSFELDSVAPWVSDGVRVHVRVRAPTSVDVELPRLENLPKGLEVSDTRRSGPTTAPDGTRSWELAFRIEVLAAGTYELPGLALRYRNSAD